MDPETEGRLKKGAALLGELWRAGERCAQGWDIRVADIPENAVNAEESMLGWACACAKPNRFCKSKRHWFKLALCELREVVEGPFGMTSMMNAEEWDLTGLTRKMEFPGVGVVSIGANGVMLATDLEKLQEAPETLESIVKLLKAFPKARVMAVLPPPPPPPPLVPVASEVKIEQGEETVEDDFAAAEAE
jgi:hypothetical protein